MAGNGFGPFFASPVGGGRFLMAPLALLIAAVAGWMWWTGRLQRMTARDGIAIGMGLVGALLLMKGKPLVGVAPMILSGIYALWRFRNPPGPSPSIPARSSDMQVAEARALLGLGGNSSVEDIRAAHRRLISLMHRDRGGTAEAGGTTCRGEVGRE